MEAATDPATTPARETSTPQHLRALQHANEVRIARADLKRQVRSGSVTAAVVVELCPWEAQTMAIGELLRTQQRWGHKRASGLLREHAISETRLIGKLTERQRVALAGALRGPRTPPHEVPKAPLGNVPVLAAT